MPPGKYPRDRLRRHLEDRHLAPDAVDLLVGLLRLDPARRLTATEALVSPYFRAAPPPMTSAQFRRSHFAPSHEYIVKGKDKRKLLDSSDRVSNDGAHLMLCCCALWRAALRGACLQRSRAARSTCCEARGAVRQMPCPASRRCPATATRTSRGTRAARKGGCVACHRRYRRTCRTGRRRPCRPAYRASSWGRADPVELLIRL